MKPALESAAKLMPISSPSTSRSIHTGTTPAHDSGSPTRPPVVGSTVTFTPRWKLAGSSPLSRCENCGRDCTLDRDESASPSGCHSSEWPRR